MTGEPCRNPACDRACESWRAVYRGRDGYCARCYKRWLDNGFPLGGPPAPRRAGGGQGIRAARLEDYAELRSWGLSRVEAARRLGVVCRTIERYERALQDQTRQVA